MGQYYVKIAILISMLMVTQMSYKFPFDLIPGHAGTGYWGRDIRCRIDSELLVDKVTALNFQKLMAMGLPFAVWREASSVLDSPLKCSCYKDTSKQPDIPCAQCYGTGFIPGYLKFGTRNYWSEATATWTMTNIVLDKVNRPFRLMLADGATTGTAISANQVVSETGKLGDWEAKADAFTRDSGANSTITVEASKDNGATYFLLSDLENQSPLTQIRFRVTLTRTAASIKTPMFEMVRARFPIITDIRNEINEPIIRAIPSWDQETEIRQSFGNKIESAAKRFWTLPLTFFDRTLSRETFEARLADDAFTEVRYGGEIGFRFSLNEFDYSDTFSKFTRQEFSLRRIAGSPGKLPGEGYYRVF